MSRVLLFISLASLLLIQAEEVKILSYNVFLRPGIIGIDDYKPERFAELQEAVRPYDIIGLCEVFDDDRRAEWKERIASTHPYQIDPPETGDPFLQDGGITFFSRYPITFSAKTIYKDADNWDAFAEKGAIFARLKLTQGQEIEVCLTHAQAGNDYFAIRQKQFTQMNKLIQDNHQQGCPVFIIGDFNVDEKVIDQYQDLMMRFQQPMDLYRSIKKDPGYTIIGYENPLVGNDDIERLDYILTHDEQQIVEFKHAAVNKFPMSNPIKTAKFMSDHYAVEAVVNIGQEMHTEAFGDISVIIPAGAALENGKLTVTDSTGNVSIQDIQMTGQQIVVNKTVSGGHFLVCWEADGRIVHRSCNAGTKNVNIPALVGDSSVVMQTPKEWHNIPVSLRLSGAFFQKQHVVGQQLIISQLPSGNYKISLCVGSQTLSKEITIQQSQIIDLENVFCFHEKNTIYGNVPKYALHSATEIIAVTENQQKISAFVEEGKFTIAAIPAGLIKIFVTNHITKIRQQYSINITENSYVSLD